MPIDIDASSLPPVARPPWLPLSDAPGITDAELQAEIDRIRKTHAWALVEDANRWDGSILWDRLAAAQRMDGRPLLLFLAHARWPLPDDRILAAAAAAGLVMLTLELDSTEIDENLPIEIGRLARHGIATQIFAAGSAHAFDRWPDLPVPRIVPAKFTKDLAGWRALNAPDAYACRFHALLAALRLPDSAMRKADTLARSSDARAQATLMRLGARERSLVEGVMDQQINRGMAALVSLCFNRRLEDLLTWGGIALPPSARLLGHNVDDLTLEILDAPEPACMPLTYGRFWFHWSLRRPDWLAIAARDGDGQMVGLALLSEPVPVEGSVGRRVLSLSVAAAHRRRGLGRRLLAAAADAAQESGTPTLFTTYSHHMVSRPHFERTLNACGWSSPEPMECTIVGQARWVRAAAQEWEPLLARAARQGFSMLPWTEVTDNDRLEIDAAIRQGEAPAEWHPDLFLRKGSEPLSLHLRYQGKVIGWIVGERDGELCVHYRRGCLFPPYRKHGFLIVGLFEACRRQAELLGENSVCVNWASAGSEMARFMETRLLPLLEGTFAPIPQLAATSSERPGGYFETRYLARKQLGEPSACFSAFS